jgi:hypothetical protein
MALTILQYWQQQQTLYQQAQASAQGDLAAAQAAQQSANKQLALDLDALDKITSGIAKKRSQLAVTNVPADANALVADIKNDLITQRGLQGKVLDDQGNLDAASASLNAAKATNARIQAKLADLMGKIAQATVDDKQRQALRQATTTAPLSNIATEASNFQTGSTFNHAITQVGKNFPPEILSIAGKRHDTRKLNLKNLETALHNAQDALGADLAADGGKQGVVGQAWIAFARAQQTLSDFVATAANRYDKARATLQMLEGIFLDNTVPDILTPAEKAQVLAPSTLATNGAAAEPAAAALDGDFNAVYTAQNGLDAQILTQIKADVDTIDSDPTVAAKRAAITSALKTFNDNLKAFATAASPNKGDLDNWEIAIPDTAWKILLDYQESLATLTELAAADVNGLATTMDTDEHNYTDALADADKAQRRVDVYGDVIGLYAEQLADAQAAITARLPSAIRGDTY